MRACVRARECVTERLGGAGGWEAQIAEAVDRLLLDVATDPAAAAAAANPFAALAAALPSLPPLPAAPAPAADLPAAAPAAVGKR